MEIILKEDVVNLGYKNDIVTVKAGYGRNYLIPTGKAVIASPAAKKMVAEELKQRAHKLEKIRKDAEAVAESLKGVSLKIATKVSSTPFRKFESCRGSHSIIVPLAQLVEHLTFNQRVLSSILKRGTIKKITFLF